MKLPLGLLLLLFSIAAPPVPAQDDARMKRWLEQVLKGEQPEADEAADRIISRLTDPLAEAIGSLENRPPAEQLRIRALASRLTGAVRSKLFRLDLPEIDRKLFDAFATQYPELTRRLFEDDPRIRLSAVRQIPLEKNTGAGVMIAARVDDASGEVADAAIEAAGRLADPVITRGLVRYLTGVIDALEKHVYGPTDEDLEIALTDFSRRIIGVLGRCDAKEAAPAAIRAFRFFLHSPLRQYFQIADTALVLGALGDESAAPALMELLGGEELRRNMPNSNGKLVLQYEGDAALLALLQIYKLDPRSFGMILNPDDPTFGGFSETEARQSAVRQFRIWQRQNGDKPAAQRQPATSQPTTKSEDDK